jgi:hypothetical protein
MYEQCVEGDFGPKKRRKLENRMEKESGQMFPSVEFKSIVLSNFDLLETL